MHFQNKFAFIQVILSRVYLKLKFNIKLSLKFQINDNINLNLKFSSETKRSR